MTRIFRIGSTKIVEDESTQGRSLDEVREILRLSFPEVAQATVREKIEGDVNYVEFLPKPGRKG
ncbi:MAG: hypothetical protein JXJ17_12035 [Anaerolineae bacterium]|nr:hypothetical protein [Anaerolineae bacterium]